jgi:hypothetical protein
MLDEKTIFIGEPRDVYIGDIDPETGDAILTSGGLTVRETGAAVNNAVITATVKTTGGSAIGAAASLANVANSEGHYLGTIPAATTLLLTPGENYDVYVTSSTGSVYRVLRFKAAYRQRV